MLWNTASTSTSVASTKLFGIGINYGHEKWWPFGAAGIYDGGARWLEIVSEAPQLQAKYAWSLIDGYVTGPTWTRDDGKFVKSGAGDGHTKAERRIGVLVLALSSGTLIGTVFT
jgi:hypothetical protein